MGKACAGVWFPLSSCDKACSKAWLKEFWKLGTGTRSEPSLSPSLSAVGGAKNMSVWRKTHITLVNSEPTRNKYISQSSVKRRLTFLLGAFRPGIHTGFPIFQHLHQRGSSVWYNLTLTMAFFFFTTFTFSFNFILVTVFPPHFDQFLKFTILL